jgi:hypothetical protein
MTENQRYHLGNLLNEGTLKVGIKAAILICFEDGERTIIPIGKTLELCNAAESVATDLHQMWVNLDAESKRLEGVPFSQRVYDDIQPVFVPDILN